MYKNIWYNTNRIFFFNAFHYKCSVSSPCGQELYETKYFMMHNNYYECIFSIYYIVSRNSVWCGVVYSVYLVWWSTMSDIWRFFVERLSCYNYRLLICVAWITQQSILNILSESLHSSTYLIKRYIKLSWHCNVDSIVGRNLLLFLLLLVL